MDAAQKARQAASFGAGADVYERARPTYPESAIDWLLPPDARRVLDLGAGTGKLSRALAARGLDVVAVDPSAEMLERLSAGSPEIVTHVGTAEAIPLGDGRIDAVLVAQAWHWVDPARAVPEVARVLAPGGTLGLVWNVRDARVPWVAGLDRLLDGGTPPAHYHGMPKVGAPFAPLDYREISWTYRLDEDSFVDLVGSRSFTITRNAEERAALLADVRAAFRRFPKTADDPTRIDLPYVTRCFRTRWAR